MKKEQLVLFMTVLLLMAALPLVSLLPERAHNSVSDLQESGAASQERETFSVYFPDTGTVKTLTAAEYLFGVTAAEMDASWPEEALKAQVAAAHSLALFRAGQRRQSPREDMKNADLSADSAVDQAYLSREQARAKWGSRADEYEARVDRAVSEAGTSVITCGGQVIDAVYHAISGGKTESCEVMWGTPVSYLVPVESAGDLLADEYLTTVKLPREEFMEILRGAALGLSPDESQATAALIGEIARSDSGTVLTVVLAGQTVTGTAVRTAFSLRSANFSLSAEDDGGVTFTVRGWGHGVGMSQYGARVMAEQGADYREILRWYYTGCTVQD